MSLESLLEEMGYATCIDDDNIAELIIAYAGDEDMINEYGLEQLSELIRRFPIDTWDVSRVTIISNAFINVASNFNEPLNSWDVSNIKNFNGLFEGCTNFNQPLDKWNVSNATNMSSMFEGCTNFNQPLNNWNVSKISDLENMFKGCTNFNQPLNNWNVSNVIYMRSMFEGCTNFNQPLDKWNVNKLRNLDNIIDGAPNLQTIFIQHFLTIEIPNDPNNSSKNLYVHIGSHGECSVKNDCGLNITTTFEAPSFSEFTYIRHAPIGTYNMGYKDAPYSSTTLLYPKDILMPFTAHYLPEYHDQYDHKLPDWEPSTPVKLKRSLSRFNENKDPLFDPEKIEDKETKLKYYSEKFYLQEESAGRTKRRFINNKEIVNKTLNMNDTLYGFNQIVFIVDRSNPILLNLKKDPYKSIYNKYFERQFEKKELTLEQLLIFIHTLGFRNITLEDSSCSNVCDEKGNTINPYDPTAQEYITRYKDKGGRRRSCKRIRLYKKRATHKRRRKYSKGIIKF
jgi:surface protein